MGRSQPCSIISCGFTLLSSLGMIFTRTIVILLTDSYHRFAPHQFINGNVLRRARPSDDAHCDGIKSVTRIYSKNNHLRIQNTCTAVGHKEITSNSISICKSSKCRRRVRRPTFQTILLITTVSRTCTSR